MNQVDVADTDKADIEELVAGQERFFASGATLGEPFRRAQLQALKATIEANEGRIAEALWADLRKPAQEVYLGETHRILTDLATHLKHLTRWMGVKRWRSPLVLQPSTSTLRPTPLGTNLILGAWNYPVQEVLHPLISAIAAGNVAVVKPSELAPASSELVAELVRSTFSPEYVACVQGGVATGKALLEVRWDHLCYTGGGHVGKLVAHAAAEHHSRVTLELGGKSPCIVSSSANLDTAASRIAWGKWQMAGQMCIGVDHLLVHDSVHDALVDKLQERVRRFYGDDPQQSPDYVRIVNARHWDRIMGLIPEDKVVFGGTGDRDDRYIAPTILTGVTADDDIMGEEIFGPVLPVLRVGSVHEAMRHVRQHPTPLALYLFSEDPEEQERVMGGLRFGGGAVNNVLAHAGDMRMPFGGVGTSGTGSYNGRWGFDRFSHAKPVLVSSSTKLAELPLKYPPYGSKLSKLKWILGLS